MDLHNPRVRFILSNMAAIDYNSSGEEEGAWANTAPMPKMLIALILHFSSFTRVIEDDRCYLKGIWETGE